MENTKNKKVPYSLMKSELYRMCYPVPENTVKNRINLIIFENRSNNYPEWKNKPKESIIKTQYVEKNELIEYFETYGLPDGLEF